MFKLEMFVIYPSLEKLLMSWEKAWIILSSISVPESSVDHVLAPVNVVNVDVLGLLVLKHHG